MAKLYGREYTRRELEGHVGRIEQLGGIRPIEFTAGRERGVRGFDIDTGSGLCFTALADRALDISKATFNGRSLAYISPAGQAHPSYYEPQDFGWLRNFPGGLLSTQGLSYLGSPCADAGEELGLHGRVSNLPMDEIGHWGEWRGDEYHMFLRGSLAEGAIFNGNLRLTRQISARLGDNAFSIDDTVTNLGGLTVPLMVLYHCNLGFPLLAPTAELLCSSRRVTPRDDFATVGLHDFARFITPTPGIAEQCYYHDMVADNGGMVTTALVNTALDGGLGLQISYDKATLPEFVEWKMMGYSDYALGLEPANCLVGGRDVERAAGRLKSLEPGEEKKYHVEFRVLAGATAIAEARERIGRLG